MLDVAQALLLFLAGALPVIIVLAIVGLPFLWWLRKRQRALALQEQRAQQLRQENRSVQSPANNEMPSSTQLPSSNAPTDESPSV